VSGYATAAQGAKADSALQSGAAISTISGLQTALDSKVSLSESSYIIAKSGDNLAEKYTAAKALTPNGSALSATNRASLIIFPGSYTLSAQLTIDAEFVDLIGLGSQTHNPSVFVRGGIINVTANNIRVSGISVGLETDNSLQRWRTSGGALQVWENCLGGDNSWTDAGGSLNGTFIGCRGGNASFGSNGSCGGTFINCLGGFNGAFGGYGGGSATGRFIECGTLTSLGADSGWYAFGGSTGPASGTFIRCSGGSRSFAGYGGATLTGIFIDCRLTSGTFRNLTAPATGKALMINCIDANGNIINGQAPL
jgi:hypothetical protein